MLLTILLTSLISFRLVRAQSQLKKVLPDSSHKVYLGIILILVESAALVAIFGVGTIMTRFLAGYTAFQANTICWILFNVSTVRPPNFFASLSTDPFPLILGPQVIIFRVATGASWSNRAESNTVFSRPIEFAPQTHSTSQNLDSSVSSWARSGDIDDSFDGRQK